MVSSNRRIHWSRRSEVQRYWRELGYLTARDLDMMQKAHVTFRVRWPTRHRRDVHNYTALVFKPLIDGFVDAGVLPDDSDKYLVGPDLRVAQQPGSFTVEAYIEEVKDDDESASV